MFFLVRMTVGTQPIMLLFKVHSSRSYQSKFKHHHHHPLMGEKNMNGIMEKWYDCYYYKVNSKSKSFTLFDSVCKDFII